MVVSEIIKTVLLFGLDHFRTMMWDIQVYDNLIQNNNVWNAPRSVQMSCTGSNMKDTLYKSKSVLIL